MIIEGPFKHRFSYNFYARLRKTYDFYSLIFSDLNKRRGCEILNTTDSDWQTHVLPCCWSVKQNVKGKISTGEWLMKTAALLRNNGHIKISWTKKFTQTRPLHPILCNSTLLQDKCVLRNRLFSFICEKLCTKLFGFLFTNIS